MTSMEEFADWLDKCQRADAPWLYEGDIDIPRQPVRGRGGKPTGKTLPTGKEGLAAMHKLLGGNDVARTKTPTGANPAAQKIEHATAAKDQDARRAHEAAAHALLAPLTALAGRLEAKWGVGRLMSLVPPEWAGKFAMAADKLQAAIKGRDLMVLQQRIDIMIRGWQKLDELADAAGAELWNGPDVWEVESPTGRVYAIARTSIDEVNAERADGVRVITLAEVALILDAFDSKGDILDMRNEFPGAVVVSCSFKDPEPETPAEPDY
jgi:hypothetical protein